jgi:hypothetical protein
MKRDSAFQSPPAPEAVNPPDPETGVLNYQLDFLRLEFQSINEIIKRIDEITQTIKNWTVLIWAGSLSLAFGQAKFRRLIVLTAVLPLPFWFVDGWWRRIQRTCIFRTHKISEFLNGPKLAESFRRRALVDFRVLDVRGVEYKGSADFEAFTGLGRTMRFRDVGGFHLALVMFSLLLGASFIFFPGLGP